MASTATPKPVAKTLSAADRKTVLGLNPDWSAADKKAVTALVEKADALRVSKSGEYVRLAAAGKSLAWVNKHHIDFPGDKPAKSLSTAEGR